MSVLRNVVFLIIFAALLIFTFLNYEFKVSVNVIGKIYQNIPLALIVLYAFLAGVIITGIFSIFEWLHQKSIIGKLKKEKSRLKEELDKLRNLPFAEKKGYLPQELIEEDEEEENE